jgi:hypothetical protein
MWTYRTTGRDNKTTKMLLTARRAAPSPMEGFVMLSLIEMGVIKLRLISFALGHRDTVKISSPPLELFEDIPKDYRRPITLVFNWVYILDLYTD